MTDPKQENKLKPDGTPVDKDTPEQKEASEAPKQEQPFTPDPGASGRPKQELQPTSSSTLSIPQDPPKTAGPVEIRIPPPLGQWGETNKWIHGN